MTEPKSLSDRARELLRAVRQAPNVSGTETLVRFLEDVQKVLEGVGVDEEEWQATRCTSVTSYHCVHEKRHEGRCEFVGHKVNEQSGMNYLNPENWKDQDAEERRQHTIAMMAATIYAAFYRDGQTMAIETAEKIYDEVQKRG